MTDLELTRLAAEAMGYSVREDRSVGKDFVMVTGLFTGMWQPLHDDAQAMALVKKLQLQVAAHGDVKAPMWMAAFNFSSISGYVGHQTENANLNRAICETVAKMVQARVPA